MSSFNNTYLSIGSNQGDKLQYLQRALDAIAQKAGLILSVSSVYQTEAYGFEAPDFYNICVKVRTLLSPQALLDTLMSIEKELGRKRKSGTGYQSRVIDIDIVLYEDLLLHEKHLTLPHPEALKRAFVLQPLAEIAGKMVFTGTGKSVSELAKSCSDTSKVSITPEKLQKPISLQDKFNYIAIEGNIGAGKTTLSNMLASQYNAKQVLERFANNPFLPKFYENNERYAFPLEMSFLADRYQQLSDDLAQFDLFKSFIISDYYIFKSLIFSQVTLPPDEYALYRKIFNVMYKEITKPDLYIYLYQNTKRLLENIKKRGRDYEQNISETYLDKIHKGYANFIQTETRLNTLIIDVSELDFVQNPVDYQVIINKIMEKR